MTGMPGGTFQVEESWPPSGGIFTLLFYVRILFREPTQSVTLIFDNSSAKQERKCHFQRWQLIGAVCKQHLTQWCLRGWLEQ